MTTQKHTNFDRLEELVAQPIGQLQTETVYRLKASGFMDLVIEILWRDLEHGHMMISLAHYFEMNRDLCSDPEMTVRAYLGERHLEAESFQQAVPPIYQEVDRRPGKFNAKLSRDLNDFLSFWLQNLKDQGHQLVFDDSRCAAQDAE